MTYTSINRAEARIASEAPFTGNSLRGEAHEPGDYVLTGRLPSEYHAAAVGARYIVFSYATPIGWVAADGTRVVPDERYSATTTRHQNVVRRAFGITREEEIRRGIDAYYARCHALGIDSGD